MASNFKTETLHAIRDSLGKNPEATVQDLAQEHDLAEADVVAILDEHHVGNDGKVTHKGPGGGGNWFPTE